MYNRYIPQSDGSYRRSFVPDPQPPVTQRSRPESPRPQEPPPREEPCKQETPKPSQPAPPCPCSRPRCPNNRSCQRKPPEPSFENKHDGNVLGFLRNLLPKEFDTGDLLVVLLLLLMAGDCKEDQNSALLTLVLYLFL